MHQQRAMAMGENFGRSSLLTVGLSAILAGAAFIEPADANPPARHPPRPGVHIVMRYDREFNNIYYKVPKGYRAADKGASGIIMLRQVDVAASSENGGIRISPGLVLDAAGKAKLKADRNLRIKRLVVIETNMGYDDAEDHEKVSEPRLVNDPAKDGYEVYLLQTKYIIPDNGQMRLTESAVVLTGDRVEFIERFGLNGAENFEKLKTGFMELLASLAFKNAGAPPPSHRAPPLGSTIEAP